MMLKIIRSDRSVPYYSPIENVQETISELYKDPANFGVMVTVVNEDGNSVEFDTSEKLSKAGVRKRLEDLQNLLW
jgi:hypothetical protein